MPNRATRVGREEPLLDLRSFARPGPAGRVRFSPAQLEQIVRTVFRAREVVRRATIFDRTVFKIGDGPGQL